MPYIEVARDVRLYYEDWGAGPVILFVHGWTISHQVWAYQTLELSRRFRTIALDLRGHGDSDKPLSTYSFPEYAHDLRNFIIALNLWNVTLVGWSMGAAICTEYLKLFGPDRIYGFVSVDGAIPKMATGPDWTFALSQATFQSWFKDLHSRRPEFAMKLAKDIFANPGIGNMTENWIWTIIMQASFPAAERSLISLRDSDFRTFIPHINIPLAVFQGAKDKIIFPKAAQWIVAHNPRARLTMFEESGHTPFIEEIDKFNLDLARFVLSLY
jgi:pimeloyl-ACP methyl ester carboxylesterase